MAACKYLSEIVVGSRGKVRQGAAGRSAHAITSLLIEAFLPTNRASVIDAKGPALYLTLWRIVLATALGGPKVPDPCFHLWENPEDEFYDEL